MLISYSAAGLISYFHQFIYGQAIDQNPPPKLHNPVMMGNRKELPLHF